MKERDSKAPRTGKGKDLPTEDVSFFRQKYKKMIDVPRKKPQEQFLLCPVGNAGSGKTTVMKPLSKRLSLVRVSGDEIRELLQDHGFNYKKVREIARLLIEEFIQKGFSVAIDSDCAGPKTQEIIKKAQKEYDLQIIWIHVDPPEEFIINKLQNYNHTWLFEDGEEAVNHYLSRKPMYEDLDMPFIYTFDTSLDSLDDQIREAEKKIREMV